MFGCATHIQFGSPVPKVHGNHDGTDKKMRRKGNILPTSYVWIIHPVILKM